MPSLLLVTTVCQADLELCKKRLEWMVELGTPVQPKDILLVNDGSITEEDFKKLAQAHTDSKLFPQVHLRKILQFSDKGQWPYTVNHVWRTTAQIVAGEYGLKFDGSPYYCWFYFEPDVTPLNKDFAAILEAQYLAQHRQFMGHIHVTTSSQGKPVRHMNGAACYPISSEWYSPAMMLTDGLPWDVAGLGETEQARMADIPDSAYVIAVGAKGYKKDGATLKATQTLYDGRMQEHSFTQAQQILHHGCKDGSLINVLSSRNGSQGEPVTGGSSLSPPHDTSGTQASLSEQIQADKKGGMKWKDMMRKYKLSPAQLSKAIKGEVNANP